MNRSAACIRDPSLRVRRIPRLVLAAMLAIYGAACGRGGGANSDVSTFCSAVSRYADQCGKLDAYSRAIAADCAAYAPLFSAAYASAAESCSETCADGGAGLPNECFEQAITSAPLTAAQRQVQIDFCQGCPDGVLAAYGVSCSQFFTSEEGGVGLAGTELLAFNDAIATMVDQRCAVPSQSVASVDCVETFIQCMTDVVDTNTNLPATCPVHRDGGASEDAAASPLTGAAAISVGNESACAVVSGGTVQCWGDNSYGALGIGTATGPEICGNSPQSPCSTGPVMVRGLSGATAVSVGGEVACALLSGGTAQCWGWNIVGQLGSGTTLDSATPVTVIGITGATAISVGSSSACALLSGGTVQCWGDNQAGELGDGTTIDSPTPVSVGGLTNATSISVGEEFACALVSGGTVQCWGDKPYEDTDAGGTPGTCTGPCSTTPVAVPGLANATAISVSGGSLCALVAGGTVECWGFDPVAVTGLTGVTAITMGIGSVCALLSGGTVQCWGTDEFGLLGNGFSGSECNNGIPCSTMPVTVAGITNATAVSAGGTSACVLLPGGTVQCWGYNNVGQLGNGTTTGPAACTGYPCWTTPVTVQ